MYIRVKNNLYYRDIDEFQAPDGPRNSDRDWMRLDRYFCRCELYPARKGTG